MAANGLPVARLLLAFSSLNPCPAVHRSIETSHVLAILYSPPCSGFLADYGAPLMLLAFSGLSFAVHGGGSGGGRVPRRVQTPNVWDASSNWSVAAVSSARGDSLPGRPPAEDFPAN